MPGLAGIRSAVTVTFAELALYAGALAVLFLTPGPVWMALLARAMAGGFQACWPLAVGVATGDAVWPLIAVFGMSWIAASYADAMAVLRWVAALMFLWMGITVLRNAERPIASDSRLTRAGAWPGFAAGVAVILANPKAILFYMGVLPGFFDLSRITGPDIVAIILLSVIIPLAGNVAFASFIDRIRHLLISPAALRRANTLAGCLLVCVSAAIVFS